MARTPTTKHTQGALKAIGHTKPGQVIYMRPDHASYDPREFAIVLPKANGSACVKRIANSMYELFVGDGVRCVEIVSQDLAASACGISQRDMKKLTDAAKGTIVPAWDSGAELGSVHHSTACIRCGRAGTCTTNECASLPREDAQDTGVPE